MVDTAVSDAGYSQGKRPHLMKLIRLPIKIMSFPVFVGDQIISYCDIQEEQLDWGVLMFT